MASPAGERRARVQAAIEALPPKYALIVTLYYLQQNSYQEIAAILGLPYPGGPELAALAAQVDHSELVFPRPMVDRPGLEFSFSGLKTFALNTIQRLSPLTEQDRKEIAFAFERAVVETLQIKCQRALLQTGYRSLVVAGGVGANRRLRQQLGLMADQKGFKVYFPAMEYCTDNGAMIAYAGGLRMAAGQQDVDVSDVLPRWSLEELEPAGC